MSISPSAIVKPCIAIGPLLVRDGDKTYVVSESAIVTGNSYMAWWLHAFYIVFGFA